MYVFTAHVALILINGYELARHRVMLARCIVHAALYICVDCFVFKVIAGKIVQKSLLTKSYHKEWMVQEIRFFF